MYRMLSGGDVGGARARHDAAVPGGPAALRVAARGRGQRRAALRAHHRAHRASALPHRYILAGRIASPF